VGLGGNNNSTTRFRRYLGDIKKRPLLPEHDLRDEHYLIQPNELQTIRLVACNGLIQYLRDGELYFSFKDDQPYTNGWFAFRTVANHMELGNFRVHRLIPEEDS
jgi:hypothetical protein